MTDKEIESAVELARRVVKTTADKTMRWLVAEENLASALLALHARNETLEKECNEWRSKTLDCENHPVVSRLLTEREQLEASAAEMRERLKFYEEQGHRNDEFLLKRLKAAEKVVAAAKRFNAYHGGEESKEGLDLRYQLDDSLTEYDEAVNEKC